MTTTHAVVCATFDPGYSRQCIDVSVACHARYDHVCNHAKLVPPVLNQSSVIAALPKCTSNTWHMHDVTMNDTILKGEEEHVIH